MMGAKCRLGLRVRVRVRVRVKMKVRGGVGVRVRTRARLSNCRTNVNGASEIVQPQLAEVDTNVESEVNLKPDPKARP
jgi:hypothetical protein